jgi:hypothetical protein
MCMWQTYLCPDRMALAVADTSISISIPHSEIKEFHVLSPSWSESRQVCMCRRHACADRLHSADRSELRTVRRDAAVSCRQMAPLKWLGNWKFWSGHRSNYL